ncbi:hypothetical protein A2Z22_03810 [Candidatus Woesebacteria bacterium RBG_16_34_12]|uniref:Uncharacterized protein n=1 Tax=Candidatus Woesebacteria bacterium RBG_16_34_12 TaxID=1802480 RepID=A0A1F7X7B7_9BACT|nr:MAG: hypothetical protein A2Z22_03810 [Candidatus Woesebacteria bacterium RBG_16_34_12]
MNERKELSDSLPSEWQKNIIIEGSPYRVIALKKKLMSPINRPNCPRCIIDSPSFTNPQCQNCLLLPEDFGRPFTSTN